MKKTSKSASHQPKARSNEQKNMGAAHVDEMHMPNKKKNSASPKMK